MKFLKLIFLMAVVVVSQFSIAQTNVAVSKHKQESRRVSVEMKVSLNEGFQRVQLENNLGVLLITVRNGDIVTMQRQVGANIQNFNLSSTGAAAAGSDCPCGYSCWEDHTLQQSICVCKSCGGGGSGGGGFIGYLKLDGIEGE